MKKINPWIVALLSAVTLEVYFYVWLAKRRAEMMREYGQSIPHWWWLVAPAGVTMALLVSFSGFAVAGAEKYTDVITGIAIALLMVLLPVAAIYVWWFWKFGKAVAYVTNRKVPAGWTLALALCTSSLVAVFVQYYFNRADPAEALTDKPKGSPSKKFIALAVTSMLVLLTVSSLIPLPGQKALEREAEASSRRMEEAQRSAETAERLFREYSVCIDELDKKYPEVFVETEAAYMAAYNDCETIRTAQNEAADRYHTLQLQ